MSCFPKLSWPSCSPDASKGILECSGSVDASQTCCLSKETMDKTKSNCPAGFESFPAKDEWCTSSRDWNPFDGKDTTMYRHKCKRVVGPAPAPVPTCSYSSDNRNCGKKGNVCPGGSFCLDSECLVPCIGGPCNPATGVCAPYAGCQEIVKVPPVQVENVFAYYNPTAIKQFQIKIKWTTLYYPINLEQFIDNGVTFKIQLDDENLGIGGVTLDVTPVSTFSYVYTAGDKRGMNMFETTFVGDFNDFRFHFPNNSRDDINSSNNFNLSFILTKDGEDKLVFSGHLGMGIQ